MRQEDRKQYLDMIPRIFVRAVRSPDTDETYEHELSEGEATSLLTERETRAIVTFLDTPAAQRILQFMCFELGQEAHLWARAGHDVPKKAEAEQAFMMTKMLKCAASHGDGWRDAYNAERREILAPIQAVGAGIRYLGFTDEELEPFVNVAASKWCAAKEREHSNDDMIYFRTNWQSLPGLRQFVIGARLKAALPSEESAQ